MKIFHSRNFAKSFRLSVFVRRVGGASEDAYRRGGICSVIALRVGNMLRLSTSGEFIHSVTVTCPSVVLFYFRLSK